MVAAGDDKPIERFYLELISTLRPSAGLLLLGAVEWLLFVIVPSADLFLTPMLELIVWNPTFGVEKDAFLFYLYFYK